VTWNARFCDLVVFAHDPLASELSLDAKGDVIIGCGRPVLLAPEKVRFNEIATVAIAWKDTVEAARAVTAAMPLLAAAKEVVVLSAREGSAKVEDALRSAERLAVSLRRHGLSARAEHVPSESKSPQEALLHRATTLNASLLVLGAYGHGRLREFIFGGFTRYVLEQSALPALVAH
jgi:nucleotide-binding universal stress UspA family protein